MSQKATRIVIEIGYGTQEGCREGFLLYSFDGPNICTYMAIIGLRRIPVP